MKILKTVFGVFFCSLIGIILHAWSALALYFCSFPAHPPLRAVLAIGYLIVIATLLIIGRRHLLRIFILSIAGYAAVALWFGTIRPDPKAVYPPELRLARADFAGNTVTVHDVRNCAYRSKDDFDVRYETRTYDLNDLQTMDVMVNYWGMSLIAHTYVSFGFSDGRYLAVSIEIRPAVGKVYGMLKGLFKQYGLIYIWADERDVTSLRTNYKKEDVYLYRTTLSPEKVRRLFVTMLERTNGIYRDPVFYNTVTQSCTNTIGNDIIASHIYAIPFWKRRILTGDVDRRLYRAGLLDTSIPFPGLRTAALIDERAIKADQDPDFSQKIRTHLTKGANR